MIKLVKRAWIETDQVKSFYKLLVLLIFSAVLMLGSSQVLGELTQSILEGKSNIVLRSFLLFALFEFLVLFINYYRSMYQSSVIYTMKKKFKSLTVLHLLNAPFSFSKDQEQGDLLGRLDSDVSSAVTASSMSVDLVKSLVLLIILAFGILYIDYRLFLLFFIPLFISTGIQVLMSSFVTGLILPWKVAMGESNALTQDVINNRGTIRIFQLYKRVDAWLEASLNESRDKGIKGIFTLYCIQSPLMIFTMLPIVSVLIGGMYLVFNGELTIAAMVSSLMISQLALDEFNPLINGMQNIPHLMTSAMRLYPIWDAGDEVFGDKVGEGSPIIKLDNVSFSYDGEVDVLSNISIEIEAGEHIGFVGGSGSGKTTLFNLINGFYVPSSGSVLVKNLEVQSWDKVALRNMFAVVSQNTYLFNQSIRDNLLYGSKADDGTLKRMLGKVNLNKDLDLIVGEKGSRLSGGERQRLSIARALLRESEILLFDEATSALDLTTEKLISDTLLHKSNNQTKLMIAHRLSSVEDCDRIYVLDKGSIVEMGVHDELMNLNGLYKSMVEKGDSYGESK